MAKKHRIAVFGVGRIGKEIIKNIETLWTDEVEIVAVIDNGHVNEKIEVGQFILDIHGQAVLKNICFEYLLLAIQNNESIYKEFTEMGIDRNQILKIENEKKESVSLKIRKMLFKLAVVCNLSQKELNLRDITLPFLAVIVGSACNLRCKDCGNFSPYAPHWSKRYSLENIIRDMEKVLEVVGGVEKLHIQGGEPFIYPQLEELLCFLIENEKIRTIQIATNGLIIPSDRILELCKNPKVKIRISNYGDVNREKTKKLKNILEGKGICQKNYEFASGKSTWYDLGGADTPETKSDEKVSVRFSNCEFNKCMTLENGEIAYCSRAIIAQSIQGFDKENDNCLKVMDELFAEKFKEFYLKPQYMEACRYCKGTYGSEEIPAAVQLDE